MPRVVNPSDALARALHAASQGLTVAEVGGFDGLSDRIREAVFASERLAVVLEQLTRYGHSRRGSPEPFQAADIAMVVGGARRAIGTLAETMPRMPSSHYEGYCTALDALIEMGHQVAERGIVAEPAEETSDWNAFRTESPRRR